MCPLYFGSFSIVNRTPSRVNCWPLSDTSSSTARTSGGSAGVTQRSVPFVAPSSRRVAATSVVRSRASSMSSSVAYWKKCGVKRQRRSVPAPSVAFGAHTAIGVPPSTGPEFGERPRTLGGSYHPNGIGASSS